MPLKKVDGSRIHVLSARLSDRYINVHYSDDVADHPDEPYVEVVVMARGRQGDAFRSDQRRLADSALTEQEQETFRALLDKLVASETADAGYVETA